VSFFCISLLVSALVFCVFVRFLWYFFGYSELGIHWQCSGLPDCLFGVRRWTMATDCGFCVTYSTIVFCVFWDTGLKLMCLRFLQFSLFTQWMKLRRTVFSHFPTFTCKVSNHFSSSYQPFCPVHTFTHMPECHSPFQDCSTQKVHFLNNAYIDSDVIFLFYLCQLFWPPWCRARKCKHFADLQSDRRDGISTKLFLNLPILFHLNNVPNLHQLTSQSTTTAL